jgi:SAM-dependent methyltransferase
MSGLTPSRRRGVEYLDAADVDPAVRVRSHRDIALANTLFGGTRALDHALRELAPSLPRSITLLDVGGGPGITVRHATTLLGALGITAHGVSLDVSEELLHSATSREVSGIRACARALPFGDGSIDVAICSLLLHHFEGPDLLTVLAELDRVTRERVLVFDLRRSWAAVAGLWAASFPLAFHPVSRHDGVTSILRGFTGDELRSLIERATGACPEVERYLGFRLAASWRPSHAEPR